MPAALAFAAMEPRIATAAECSAEPDCPSGMSTNRICRRPCEGGGYFYQFGSNCMDGTEPVNGSCSYLMQPDGRFESVFSAGGGTAAMRPGARRPGEEYHGHSFSILWDCPAVPSIPGARGTTRRVFTFRYERKPWGHGSYRMEDARFQSAEWNQFLANLDVNQVNYTSCLEQARRDIWEQFNYACQVTEIAAGLQPPLAVDKCRNEQRDRYAGPLRHAINLKVIATSQATGARARLLPFSAATPEQSLLLNSLANSLTDCSVNPRYLSPRLQEVILSREFLVSHLPNVVSSTSATCRQDLLRFYLDRLADIQMPACRVISTTSGCAETRQATVRTLAALSTAYNGAVNSRGARMFAHNDHIGVCVVTAADPASEIRDLQLAAQLAGQCVDLRFTNPRESAIIDMADTGTGLDGKYRLTRTGQKSYRVDLRLTFTPSSQQAARTESVNRCLREVNPDLKGPNGQTLELALTNDAEVPSNPIRIVEAGARSTSAAWKSDIDCPTITHELMHLLGLVDEYHERSIGHVYDTRTGEVRYERKRPESLATGQQYHVGYNCRVRGPNNSLMSYHREAFKANRGFLGTNLGRDRDSLLYPAHFNAITHPGCYARNRTYYRCARYAYDTSVSRFGEGCESGKPAECRNGDSWLQENP